MVWVRARELLVLNWLMLADPASTAQWHSLWECEGVHVLASTEADVSIKLRPNNGVDKEPWRCPSSQVST